jgi:hypothetical protein
MSDEQLRLIPRVEFATRHFPQSSCSGCHFLKTCTALLSASYVQMAGDFWLVRGDNGECARKYSDPPPDLQTLRRREMNRLSSMSGETSAGVAAKRRVLPARE